MCKTTVGVPHTTCSGMLAESLSPSVNDYVGCSAVEGILPTHNKGTELAPHSLHVAYFHVLLA